MDKITNKINPTTVRFSGAPWYEPNIPVIVGGVGGIGSWLALALSRQECDLYLYDNDIVDETNLGGQFYETSDIGTQKVDVIAKKCRTFSNNIVNCNGIYDKDSLTNSIVFSAFDNMEARKIMFGKWVEHISKYKSGRQIFIDGRLLMETMKIFAVTFKDIDRYREYLWEDSEIPDVPCSNKATTFASMIIAGNMVSIYNNYLTNYKYSSMVREVPFLTEIDLPLSLTTIKL